MSCALWVPEVGIGDVEKMEPITRIETITVSEITCTCMKDACYTCTHVKTYSLFLPVDRLEHG